MATLIDGVNYQGVTVHLDGDNDFRGCHFEHCTLVYSGLRPARLDTCYFDGCDWRLEGAAAETLAFLASLYGVDGMRGFIETTFDNIRGRSRN